VKITLTRSRCEGHGLCATVAPDAFSLDEEGTLTVLLDGEIPDESARIVAAAARACPVTALSVAG
jgi:ferredoxin